MATNASDDLGRPKKRAKASPCDAHCANGSEGNNSPSSSYRSGDDASRIRASTSRPRRNAPQACKTCRRQKTRCEPPIEPGLQCHRCGVLGVKCSFQDEGERPACISVVEGRSVSEPPADLDGIRNFMRLEVDTRAHLRSRRGGINNLSPPPLPHPDQHPDTSQEWIVPPAILDALLRQVDKSKSPNESAYLGPSPQLASSKIAELRQIGVARFASWLALPPELLQPGVSAFLDSVLVLLGSRQPAWCRRLNLSAKLYCSIGSEAYAAILAPPSPANICGLLLLALWGPLFEDKVHTGELALVKAAELMGRRLRLDAAARGLEFLHSGRPEEVHARARLWLCIAVLDTLLSLIAYEIPALASELSPTIATLRGFPVPRTAPMDGDERLFQEAEFLAGAATSAALLANHDTSDEDIIKESEKLCDSANETRRSLRRVSALVGASGNPFKIDALHFMTHFVTTLIFPRAFASIQSRIRRSQILAGHALTPSCTCPACSYSHSLFNTVIQSLSGLFMETLEDTLVSFLSLSPAEDPDVPQIYLIGVTYATAFIFKIRMTALEAWEMTPNGTDTVRAPSDVTLLVQRVGQRLLGEITPELGSGGGTGNKEASLSVRFGKLCNAMTEMWNSAKAAAEAERRKCHEPAAPASALPDDSHHPSAPMTAPAGSNIILDSPEVGELTWAPDADLMRMFRGSVWDFGLFGEPNLGMPYTGFDSAPPG